MFNVFNRLRSYFTGFGSTFLVFWSVLFLAVFAVSMCDPALPYLVRDFLVEEAAVVAVLSYLNSVLNLSRTVASFSAGILADRIGKRKVILASLCLSLISFLLYLHIYLYFDYLSLMALSLLVDQIILPMPHSSRLHCQGIYY